MKFIIKQSTFNPASDIVIFETIDINSENIKSGFDLVYKLCEKNTNVNNILFNHINNGMSVHFINPDSNLSCANGENDLLYKFSEYDLEIILKNKGYFIIVYPETNILLSPSPTIINKNINKIKILLDVDGVINIVHYEYKKSDIDKYDCYKTIDMYAGFGNAVCKIRYRTAVCDAIRRWSQYAEILWLTSWVDMARYRLAPLIGLPDFKLAPFRKWFIHEQFNFDDELKGLIWIDDELNYMYKNNVKQMQQKCDENNVASLFVSTTETNGLSDEEIKLIDNFLINQTHSHSNNL